jgi:hypothetical protein
MTSGGVDGRAQRHLLFISHRSARVRPRATERARAKIGSLNRGDAPDFATRFAPLARGT